MAIEASECDIPLNGKGEWGANIVPRASFDDPNRAFKLNRNSMYSNNIQLTIHNDAPDRIDKNGSDKIDMNDGHRHKKRKRVHPTDMNGTEARSITNSQTLEVNSESASSNQFSNPSQECVQGARKVVPNKTLSVGTVVPNKTCQKKMTDFVRNMNRVPRTEIVKKGGKITSKSNERSEK